MVLFVDASGLFTVAAVDNIDYIPSATTAKDSFHGTGISLMLYVSFMHLEVAVQHINPGQVPSLACRPTFVCTRQANSVDLPVHIRDMISLSEKHSEVLAEFCAGKFAVHKTSNKFSMMAIDQLL